LPAGFVYQPVAIEMKKGVFSLDLAAPSGCLSLETGKPYRGMMLPLNMSW